MTPPVSILYLFITLSLTFFTIVRLPQDQDCHEMWSKQRRRKLQQQQPQNGKLIALKSG